MGATATLASRAIVVQPGSEAMAEVRVRNSGTIVDQFTLEVLGDAAGWSIVEPGVIPLFPGAEATARIRFRPPKSSSIPAKAFPFAIRVKSREDPRASMVEEGVVEVGSFHDTFAELIPRNAHGSTRGRAQLALDNRGNVRINTRLTAADPDRKLNFEITPAGLIAEPGTANFARVRVTPRQRFFNGPAKTLPYKVFVHQDGQPTVAVDGTMTQVGILPGWFLPAILGLVGVMLALAILYFVVLRPTVNSLVQAQTAAAVQQAKSAAAVAKQAAQTAVNAPAVKANGGASAGAAGGASGPNPLGGNPFAGRLSSDGPVLNAPAGPDPAGKDNGVTITDLVFENPDGNSGVIQLKRGGDVLLNLRLENFRDLDFHFVTPLQAVNGQTINMVCSPDPGQKCTASVYYSGYKKG